MQKRKEQFGQNRSFLGVILIIFSIFFTLSSWFLMLHYYKLIFVDPFLFLSKFFVLIGTLCMCWTFVLATRIKYLEILFVGLDRVYNTHKILGQISFYTICLHVIFQFLRKAPNWSAAFGLFYPFVLDGTSFGLFAFLTFTILIALTLWVPIPYHIWKRTHEFFILVLLLAFFHVYLIDKHVNSLPVLSFIIYGAMLIAFISYIYTRFLYKYFGPKFVYVVKNIEQIRNTWDIYLQPVDKSITYKPGQFVYISFFSNKLSSESHPFSISSYPSENFLRVSIKELGDYTSKIKNLCIGDNAQIWGPYGFFYEKFFYEKKDAVFISGGIGITPFLSMLGHEAYDAADTKRKTYLFYCVKNQSRADYDKELKKYSAANSLINYIPYFSEKEGFITAEKIKNILGSLENKNFFICGPKPMMDALSEQLTKLGVKNRYIIFEDFNFL